MNPDRVENDLSVRYERNERQTLVVVEGEQVAGVIALDQAAEIDETADFVDSLEAELAHKVEGLRDARETVALADGGDNGGE